MHSRLVILKRPYLGLILSGEKTIELRLTQIRNQGFSGGR
jgi:ASC-1-like (ASCH) protein